MRAPRYFKLQNNFAFLQRYEWEYTIMEWWIMDSHITPWKMLPSRCWMVLISVFCCCCWCWCWCFFCLFSASTIHFENVGRLKKTTLRLTLANRGKMCKKNEKNSEIWQLNYAALPFARLSAEVPGEKVIDSSCSLHHRWLRREEALRLKAGLAFFSFFIFLKHFLINK